MFSEFTRVFEREIVPLLRQQKGFRDDLLHLLLCMCAATTILYVSRTRAEYLWLGALGGIALMLITLSPALTVPGTFGSDVICVAVFVGYYKLFVARTRTPSSGGGHGSGYRAH